MSRADPERCTLCGAREDFPHRSGCPIPPGPERIVERGLPPINWRALWDDIRHWRA